MIGLYFHVPFCAVKCPYCDFYSVPARPPRMDAYLTAVLSELDAAPGGLSADTVYFGGGTPILLGPERLAAILEAVKQKFSLTEDAEITLEANPFSFPARTFTALRRAGFNRLSLGVQSAVPEELRALGRLQGPALVREAVRKAREAGFRNLSADLMLGVPGQTEATLRTSVSFLEELDFPHVSAYLLKAEEGTPFARAPERLPDDDRQAALYLCAVSLLEATGLSQYEISNFAKHGFVSRHNLKYWRREPYLGFGPAAHSFFDGVRFAHPRDLDRYLEAKGDDRVVTDPAPDPLEESLMLGLRLTEGVFLDALGLTEPKRNALLSAAEPLQKAGLLRSDGARIALTPRGFLVSNSVILRLLSVL